MTYEGQQNICCMELAMRAVCTAVYASGHTKVGPSAIYVLGDVPCPHQLVTCGGRQLCALTAMLAPKRGSKAKKVFGLLTGVCKYMFAAHAFPEGHGVAKGRNSVGVPVTVRTVDNTLVIEAC